MRIVYQKETNAQYERSFCITTGISANWNIYIYIYLNLFKYILSALQSILFSSP